jgi:hypothetical protein
MTDYNTEKMDDCLKRFEKVLTNLSNIPEEHHRKLRIWPVTFKDMRMINTMDFIERELPALEAKYGGTIYVVNWNVSYQYNRTEIMICGSAFTPVIAGDMIPVLETDGISKSTNHKTFCAHKWKTYLGLSETYEYCTKCGDRK